MPFFGFDSAEHLNSWRDTDDAKATAWTELSTGWKYCSYDKARNAECYPSLTLDEFCCQSLSREALDRRNCDQVILSIQPAGEKKMEPGKESLGNIPAKNELIVIKQAWMWKVHDVFIVSGGAEKNDSPLLVVEDSFERFYHTKGLSRCIGIMMAHMVISIENDPVNPKYGNIFRMFEQAITAVSEKVDTYLRDVSIEGIRIETEKECLHLIIDIQEELSMIKRVILQQEMVWRSFSSKAWPHYWPNGQDGSMVIPPEEWRKYSKQGIAEEWEFIHSAESKFKEYYRRIAQLDEDAQRVERSVTAMLDLKSKHATIREAHTSAIMGAAVVGFTIVTIIFTPLSYMATLFALPINTLQDKQDNSKFTDQAGAYKSSYFARWTCEYCSTSHAPLRICR